MTGAVVDWFVNNDIVMFSGMSFLFGFLPLFFIVYYTVPHTYRRLVMLLGSLLFYALGEPHYVLLLLAAVGMNYLLASELWDDGNRHIWRTKRRKRYLAAAVLLDVVMLAGFKLLHAAEPSCLLPLGISFFTFKMIAFQADAYRGLTDKPDFIRTAAYFTMFAQVTSGPVMRYAGALAAYNNPDYSAAHLEDGLRYFVLGLSAKVLLADRLATLWNELQMIGFESISTPLAWLGAAGYSLNLYFDFAGYSLMACGIGMMLGYPPVRNFDHPYAAGSVREFWRRWHITLGTWFRDYVYIPLGGSRGEQGHTIRNLLIVWLLTGFWHGSGWNFVIWGLALFALIAAERLFLGRLLDRSRFLSHCYVLLVIPLTWILFAVTDLRQLGIYFTRLFPFFGASAAGANPQDYIKYLGLYAGLLAAGIVFCIPAVSEIYEKYKTRLFVAAGLAALFWVDIYYVINMANNPFRYFEF